MSDALVSCVVPVYNGARHIADALRSILDQTHRPIEIVVVDDGSTDETAEVVARFNDRVRYVRQENAGCGAARNRGIEETTGPFVAFLDADDLWHEEKLSRQLACFEARPDLDYCVTHVQNFWETELQEEAERFRDHARAKSLPGYVAQALLARRSLFATVGAFDPGIAYTETIDWFMRANRLGAVSELLPDVLVRRRLHRSNITRGNEPQSQEEVLRLLKRRLDESRNDSA